MGELVNLRQARKVKIRADKDKVAEANRLLHGTPKNLRNLAKARSDKADQDLDAHRLKENEAD